MSKKLQTLTSSQKCFIYFIVAIIICLGLNLGVLKDYIFLDANEYIYTATRNPNFHNEFIQGGRPLLGYWCEFLYGYVCQTVADLKWVRLFTLVTSVLFSAQVLRFLLVLNFKFFEASIFALLILALPTFTVYYSWSATAEIPLLLIINFYAGQLLLKALQRPKILSFIISFVIVLISLFVYQSVVMVFVLPFVFTAITKQAVKLKDIIYILSFTLLCFIPYFILFKVLLVNADLEATNRTVLSIIELPKKLIKFHVIELKTLLQNSGFLLAPILAFVLGFICFCGFFLTLKFKTKQRWMFMIMLACVLAFSYAPNILSGQDYFSLRTIAPTAILVLFYQFYFLRTLILRHIKWRKFILILPFIMLGLSFYNGKFYITDIQNKEYEIVKQTFRNIDLKATQRITIIRPEYGFLQKQGYLKNGFSGEFGNLSSVKYWATPHLFSQIFWEVSGNNDKTIEIFSPKNISVITESDIQHLEDKTVINLIEIFKNTFAKD